MPTIDVTPDEAERIVVLVDGYIEQRQLVRRIFEEIGTMLGTDSPVPISTAALTALEQLREKYAALQEPHAVAVIARADLMRAIRAPREISYLAGYFSIHAHHIEPMLLQLEEDQHARQIEDGQGRVLWEITEAGEREL